MNDFTIRRVTDPKEGPIDGVSAETVGEYIQSSGEKAYFRQRNVSSSRKQRM